MMADPTDRCVSRTQTKKTHDVVIFWLCAVVVVWAQPHHGDVDDESTVVRLPRCAVPIVVMVPLEGRFQLGVSDGFNSGWDLESSAPVVMAGDCKHYGSAQRDGSGNPSKNRRLHVVFTDGLFKLMSNQVRAGCENSREKKSA